MSDSSAADLIAHAHGTRVAVVGGGIAGLVAALECAKVGIAVTVLEASPHVGGALARAELDGLDVDLGADGFDPGDAAVSALIAELGLSGDIVTAPAGAPWISGLPSGAAPLPADALWGIPANPWADEVRRFIGWRGAWRAYVDRLRPPLTIGREQRLGVLVRTRMGDRVRDRMVAPLTQGALGLDPDRVDVDAVAPGLNTALTRVGSLGGAVAQHLPAAAQRATLTGGMARLAEALVTRIAELDGDVRVAAPVSHLERTGDSWQLHSPAGGEPVTADAVIIATGQSAAQRLLAPVVSDLPDRLQVPAPIDVITLVVTALELDVPPRGAVVYPVPGTAVAQGLSHLTATWPELAAAAGPGRHVVRVTLPAAGDTPVGGAPADADADADADVDADALARALAEAALLLGVDLPADRLRAGRRVRREWAAPASALGHDSATAAVRTAVGAAGGLAVVGEWISGSGLEAVVADALAEAERVRHAALWGSA